ncbi:MAG: fused MFS/spermidine synthase [Caulobacter sp.]|nr:fused MFS/spermidine synthase [Caulobacter sp.]
MTDTIEAPRAAGTTTPPLFVVSVFTSAALVFMVQPMVAKLVLPLLGGSPAVWNTSMAFFQIALLVGYGYAHVLQKIQHVRRQITVHIAALVIAGLTLFPLSISTLAGEPSSNHPALWLLAVLTLSIGLPFAILSATAPLVQAWHARVFRGEGAGEPYSLYAASNLGSLLALLAYPVVMEPLQTLQAQRWTWSGGYWAFVLILAALAMLVWKRAEIPAGQAAVAPVKATPAPTWRERAIWVALAAIPSSLMLGVTAHLATDVASAPFLWVAPLALYLVTFIIAFQTKPAIPRWATLTFQAAAVAACAATLQFGSNGIELQIFVHLACFFLTALVCHQALVARRPDPEHLTEFYLCMSLGGVVGGSFNAFVAPVIFRSVLEYPLMLALSVLARPWGRGRLTTVQMFLVAIGLLSALMAAVAVDQVGPTLSVKLALAATTVTVFLMRDRALLMFALMVTLLFSASAVGDRVDVIRTDRSFFGVLRQSRLTVPRTWPTPPPEMANFSGGEVRLLAHGTTLHGAQAVDPRYHCRPLVYYAPETPIGQVFTARQAVSPALRIGAVGLGTGSVAGYVRPGDHLTFFEIDPLVIRISHDSGQFDYTTKCARGPVDFVLGDARLTLEKQPKDAFDILLIDAFSSDAVPAHLLTVEAVRGYLTHIKPDGVLILHLSNRNLELTAPAMAVARAAGGHALLQEHRVPSNSPNMWESSEDALIIARTPQALARFRADPRWTPSRPDLVRPWTDDYTNLVGAMLRRMQERSGPMMENLKDAWSRLTGK